MAKFLKQYWFDALVVVVFAAISFAYFFPADIEGRILYRHDSSEGRGAGQELREHFEQTGERTRWTNATFAGMPTYQTAPSYDSTDILSHCIAAYHFWLPENVWYVFVYLLGFYILLRAFDFRRELAALGSVVWAFSSYFFIIIAAGHIWKVMALAYLPPLIAGVVLAYRGKYLWGFILTAVFAAFEIKANHVQMTYYFLFVVVFMVVAFLVEAIRQKTVAQWLKASAVCLVGGLLGAAINLSNLYHTWQYGQESMRGKSELVKADAANQTPSGLDRDYITQWSYGIDETLTLLVPNAKGGASVPLVRSETAMEKADPMFQTVYQQLGQYWGNQPGTSGPVYVGAFVLLLFVLGLFVVKGPMKWALLAATVLSVLLSWGHNFMWMTDLFLDYMPMYAKFRTVASILVIAEFTIPLLAMMALKKIVDQPSLLKTERTAVGVSLALTAGLCLVFALVPSLFPGDVISHQESMALGGIDEVYRNPLMANLREMRYAVLAADCWRSFVVIAIGAGLVALYYFRRLSAPTMVWLLAALCLVDMWQVNKRYLNDAMFVPKSEREAPQAMTETDKLILEDTTLDYRVLNLATNTFNENETSYYHKSIGGYHAAKLRRYQELIDAYITKEMQGGMRAIAEAAGDMEAVSGDSIFPVLNMLNTKYFIVPLQDTETLPLENPYAQGNAWFVDRVNYVDNANAELDALAATPLRREAVADKRFEAVLGQGAPQDSTAAVRLTDYKPNALVYETQGKEGVVVFSEIYYPGWTATIDGQTAELGRVNYVLRALRVPAGKHTVQLEFKPKSIDRTEAVAYTAYLLLLLAIAAGVFFEMRRRKE